MVHDWRLEEWVNFDIIEHVSEHIKEWIDWVSKNGSKSQCQIDQIR